MVPAFPFYLCIVASEDVNNWIFRLVEPYLNPGISDSQPPAPLIELLNVKPLVDHELVEDTAVGVLHALCPSPYQQPPHGTDRSHGGILCLVGINHD